MTTVLWTMSMPSSHCAHQGIWLGFHPDGKQSRSSKSESGGS